VDDDVAPAAVAVVRGFDQGVGEFDEGVPVVQCEGAGVSQFVLGLLELALSEPRPLRDPCA
jgi:hypothetical protein